MMLLAALTAIPMVLVNAAGTGEHTGEWYLSRDDPDKGRLRLLVKSLGKKNQFGTAEWSTKRGTPLRWQWVYDEGNETSEKNHKIQVLGKFKKKDLCLWWRGDYTQPFNVKPCEGALIKDSPALKFGCVDEGGQNYFGKRTNTGADSGVKDITKLKEYKAILEYTLADGTPGNLLDDNTSIHDGTPIATNVCDSEQYKYAPIAYPFQIDQADWAGCSGCFTLFTNGGGQDRYFGVQHGRKDMGKNGNPRGDIWAWKATQKQVANNAAVLKWAGDYIQVVGPKYAHTDGQSLCLELDKTKTNQEWIKGEKGMPLKVQKCDKTIDNGRFGCHDDYFGMKWNAKRLKEANEAYAKCPAADQNCINEAQKKGATQMSRLFYDFYSLSPGDGGDVENNRKLPCHFKNL